MKLLALFGLVREKDANERELMAYAKGFSDANRTLQLFMQAAMRDAQAEQGIEKQEYKH